MGGRRLRRFIWGVSTCCRAMQSETSGLLRSAIHSSYRVLPASCLHRLVSAELLVSHETEIGTDTSLPILLALLYSAGVSVRFALNAISHCGGSTLMPVSSATIGPRFNSIGFFGRLTLLPIAFILSLLFRRRTGAKQSAYSKSNKNCQVHRCTWYCQGTYEKQNIIDAPIQAMCNGSRLKSVRLAFHRCRLTIFAIENRQ